MEGRRDIHVNMPAYAHITRPESKPTDVSVCLGWTVDIWAYHNGEQKIIYRDCSLATLVRASALFERLARDTCSVPLAYGDETKLTYLLPRAIAAAAFKRILDWIYAIMEISGHGEIEDPQITTFEEDGLTQYLRLLQTANFLELKYPYHNQKRLPDMIKANIKKAFDTKNNAFHNVTISDREIGLIWDVGKADRNDSTIKLMLALFVDVYDARKETPKRFKDDIVQRFDKLVEKNGEFRSAVIDIKTKKDVRLREEERERKGLPKAMPQRRGKNKGDRKNGGQNDAKKSPKSTARSDDSEDWRGKELTQQQAEALMRRPQEFQLAYANDHNGSKYASQYYGQNY